MRYLLDSHILLWHLLSPEKIKPSILSALQEDGAVCFVSYASIWEITIKKSIGKLELPAHWLQTLQEIGFMLLPITLPHLLKTEMLPYHHRDPFDRLLVAQAAIENLAMVTADTLLSQYDIRCLIV